MPRLTIRFLCKVFILVIFMVFVMPMLMHWSDSYNAQKEEESHRRHKRDSKYRKDDILKVKLPDDSQLAVPPKDVHKDDIFNRDKEMQQKQPPNAKDVENKILESNKKEYGPKAVLKQGQLGNFEPNIVPKPGPGEMGEAVFVSMQERPEADRTVQEYGFNMVASDKISMDRNVPDTRLDQCKYWHYPTKLPTASVILVFHNEGWSTLMRTVHSVINTSPPHLLKEVVMVDDYSDKEHLKSRLDEYIKKPELQGKVKLYRNKERLGLIKTRTMGAKYSIGDVIVFLDAHCECNRNWLVPLLARVAYDRTIMAVPIVDSIDWNTLSYRPTYQPGLHFRGIFEWGFLYKEGRVPAQELYRRTHLSEPYRTIMAVPIVDGIDWNNMRYSPVYQHGDHFRGIFEWGFLYKESRVPQKVLDMRTHESEPYRSPTHAGGLFAMDRKYFFELGGYDPGLQIWGGENFELSFKIWQCGGSIEWVPCSRVGHIYRNHMPYGFGKLSTKIPVILLNYMRVVEVWLDPEFREYFYTREPTIRGYPIGDISQQVKFREDHKCKSFKWFMENVAFEVYEKFPPPPPNVAWGEVKEKHGYLCWDTQGQQVNGGTIGVSGCHHYGGNQLFRYDGAGVLHQGERRLVALGPYSDILSPMYYPDSHGVWLLELYRLNKDGQLAVGERCLEHGGGGVHVTFCPAQPLGPWQWDKSTGQIKHSRYGTCVEKTRENKLSLQNCDVTKHAQQWEINTIRTW